VTQPVEEIALGRPSRSEQRRPVHDVTACIPTVGEAGDVVRTVRSLLHGRAYPGTILVSDASHDQRARSMLEQTIEALGVPNEVEFHALASPPNGSATGNRNWLAGHVRTPLLLFVDDDVDVHRDFLHDAVASISAGRVDVVVAASPSMGGSGWLTARGHFRPIEPGDPIAVGLACSLWRSDLFCSLWLDERIDYGYEDADLSLRLHRLRTSAVEQSAHDFIHRSDGEQFDEIKDRNAERARVYVSAKRHAKRRRSLLRFLILEISCNALRRRRLVPRAQVPGQWWSLARYLMGGEAPLWARVDAPLASTADGREREA
jgi:hypothetical protein